MLRKRVLLFFFSFLVFMPLTASANSVVDIYNIVRRQMMKNEEMVKYLENVRDGSSDLKTLMSDYKTDIEKDWILKDPKDKDSELLNYADQIKEINKILGPYGVLGKSIATEQISCLLGEDEDCIKVVETNYQPVVLNSLSELKVLEYLFADPTEEDVEEVEDELGNIVLEPIKAGTEADFQRWVEENMTSNMKSTKALNTSEQNFELAIHNALAQGYGVSVVSRRSGEIFDETVQAHMKQLIQKMNPSNIREAIHLIIGINSQIIYQLGQINAIQGMISEISATSKIGSIQGIDGTLKIKKEEKQ